MLKFVIDGKEAETYDAWRKKHDETCPKKGKCGAIGGRMTYSFSPTTLGTTIEISCACGEKVNVTDYSGW